MTFSHPSFFYLLLLQIPLVAVMIQSYRKTFLSVPMFVNNPKLSNRAFLKVVLLNTLLQLAFIFLVIAAAGPSWGSKYTQEERKYVDVVFAVDISRSMMMPDVYPTRLDHAASLVRSLLADEPGIRYSLSVIKGGAFELVPMTTDKEAIRLATESLSPSMVTTTGTDLGGSLRKLLLSYPENMQTDKIIFLFSDGGDGIRGRRAVCDIMKEHKVTVYTIAIGTESEEPLVDANGYPVLYRGKTVSVPVKPEEMRLLAAETGGEFFQSGGSLLVSQLRRMLLRHAEGMGSKSYVIHNRDDSVWFAFAAFVALWCWYLVRVFLWRKDI